MQGLPQKNHERQHVALKFVNMVQHKLCLTRRMRLLHLSHNIITENGNSLLYPRVILIAFTHTEEKTRK